MTPVGNRRMRAFNLPHRPRRHAHYDDPKPALPPLTFCGRVLTVPVHRSMHPSEPDFRLLYEAHVDFVWRCLRRFGVREADLMDVTQKVFLTAFMKRDDFEGRSALTSWLFGICQRIASDYRRSAPIRREVALDSATAEQARADSAQSDPARESESRQHAVLADTILQK